MSDVGAPTPRALMPSVWSGTALAVWGGLNQEGTWERTGAFYNPETDHWTTIPEKGAPTARGHHVGAWIGTRLFVYGGEGVDVDDADISGGTFASPGTWAAINGPACYFACGAWTGTDYVYSGSFCGKGQRFNPESGWTALPMLDGPEERRDCQAVWTGQEVIVFGGTELTEGMPIRTGGRYNPTTDKWAATSTKNAPQVAFHSVVWSGSELIVFGGVGPLGELVGSGARYSPATDTWTPISTVNAPSPRAQASAVWTGSRMLVWGGFSQDPEVGTGNLGDGASYDPQTDTWTPLTGDGAPSARALAAAVWTGRGMIVWGGDRYSTDDDTMLGDGAIYYPSCPD